MRTWIVCGLATALAMGCDDGGPEVVDETDGGTATVDSGDEMDSGEGDVDSGGDDDAGGGDDDAGGGEDSGGGIDSGVEMLNCRPTEDICGESCVNTQTDPANCGACETACGMGQVCSLGSCGDDCDMGLENCDGACADTDRDPANCGGCGTTCSDTQACLGGTCTCGPRPNRL